MVGQKAKILLLWQNQIKSLKINPFFFNNKPMFWTINILLKYNYIIKTVAYPLLYFRIWMEFMKKSSVIPIPVNKILKKLGEDLNARIKRNLTMALVEERAGITHVTFTNIEKGSGTVSIGNYAKVIFVFGLIDNLYKLLDEKKDIFML